MTEINGHSPEELELVANVRPPTYPRFPMREVEESLNTTSILHNKYGQENLVRGEPTEKPRQDWVGIYVVKAVKDEHEEKHG